MTRLLLTGLIALLIMGCRPPQEENGRYVLYRSVDFRIQNHILLDTRTGRTWSPQLIEGTECANPMYGQCFVWVPGPHWIDSLSAPWGQLPRDSIR